MTLDLPHSATGAATADIIDLPTRRGQGKLKLALIGGFAPRKCGIATFTTDIYEQVGSHQPRVATTVWAMEDAGGPPADDRVDGRIRSDRAADYRAAAAAINDGGFDVAWLQHEYGIFGGDCGEMVIELAERIAVPLIVTFHTVLTEPSPKQREILERLVAHSSQVMVMSRHSRGLLIDRYGVEAERVSVIAHGAPDRPCARQAEYKHRIGLNARPVLMTFGLLGPGKGIETMISALPAVVARHPDAMYRIVGASHPNLVAAQGEAYREKLERLADELGVADNVVFDNRFLDNDELLDQLEACDIYVTPYPNLQQSTSGTLAYAVALGKAVVSTPYVHARELSDDGAGLILVEPGAVDDFTQAVLGLLDDPQQLSAMQEASYAFGRATIWPEFAAAAASLVERATVPRRTIASSYGETPALAAVLAMTDSTGIMQHSIGVVPDRRHGYCLDDNVRALLLMARARALPRDERERLVTTYASFIQHAWNPDRGLFRNFMNFDRSWCEDAGSEDSNGRTAWALGELIASDLGADWRDWAGPWFDLSIGAMEPIGSPRALAFATLGATAAVRSGYRSAAAVALLERAGAFLYRLLEAARRPDWAWFEAVLGYDNPRLPQALLEAGIVLDRPEWRSEALDSLAWIAAQQRSASGYFRPVGSEGFGIEYANLPFDQQPLEAWAAIDAAASAHAATRDPVWIKNAAVAHAWYFGANDRGIALGDLATGRCRDGVTPRGANANCGAESVLAFQLACYAMAALAHGSARDDAGNRLGRSTQDPADPAAHSR